MCECVRLVGLSVLVCRLFVVDHGAGIIRGFLILIVLGIDNRTVHASYTGPERDNIHYTTFHYYIILYYITLYYTVLHCTILYYIILY